MDLTFDLNISDISLIKSYLLTLECCDPTRCGE